MKGDQGRGVPGVGAALPLLLPQVAESGLLFASGRTHLRAEAASDTSLRPHDLGPVVLAGATSCQANDRVTVPLGWGCSLFIVFGKWVIPFGSSRNQFWRQRNACLLAGSKSSKRPRRQVGPEQVPRPRGAAAPPVWAVLAPPVWAVPAPPWAPRAEVSLGFAHAHGCARGIGSEA